MHGIIGHTDWGRYRWYPKEIERRWLRGGPYTVYGCQACFEAVDTGDHGGICRHTCPTLRPKLVRLHEKRLSEMLFFQINQTISTQRPATFHVIFSENFIWPYGRLVSCIYYIYLYRQIYKYTCIYIYIVSIPDTVFWQL